MKRTLFAIATSALVVALVGCGKPGPATAVSTLEKALGSGDVATAREQVDMRGLAFRYGMSMGALEEGIEQASAAYRKRGGVDSVSIEKEAIEGRQALVVYTLRYGNGDVETMSIQVTQDDFDRWKVSTFSTLKK